MRLGKVKLFPAPTNNTLQPFPRTLSDRPLTKVREGREVPSRTVTPLGSQGYGG